MAAPVTILCCENIKFISPPHQLESLPVSPFDILFDQAGRPTQDYDPQVPFTSLNYYRGVLLVEHMSVIDDLPPTGGYAWYSALRLPDDTPGRLVEIPFQVPDRAQADGMIEETGEGQYTCTLGNCPNHPDLEFMATWHHFTEGQELVEEENNENDDGEDSDEIYKDLRARVKKGRGVPCDECSKNRRSCSRSRNPGGPPKCTVCQAKGVECTWDTVGGQGRRRGLKA